MAYVVNTMGKDAFREYMLNKFDLKEETGIDLPNEASPLIANLSSTRDIEYVTASFGQGVSFSPIAITRALASLGNGGLLVTPHVVKRIEYDIGVSKTISPDTNQRALRATTSEEITRMLVNVFDTHLLGGKYKKEHYRIAAKTGTAQMADGKGGYYDDRYLHSFFGYFPAYNPRFIIFLYTVYPKGVEYASNTLTDPFMKMTDFLLSYYNIPPDR
jgi:cell division protein FtsI/penicillin-binding protein 2